MRRVWHVERSEGVYADVDEGEEAMVGMEVAGGTMVVEDVVDDTEVVEAERVDAGAAGSLVSLKDEGAW